MVVPPKTMKSSYLTNLVLITLLAGLYWFINDEPTTQISTTTISTINSDAIHQITISQTNRADIIINKTNDHWQLTAPITARANQNRIKLLLSLLTMQPHRQQAVSAGQDLSQFGLKNDSTSLILDKHHFVFGDIEPIEQRRYILHNNHIYLLEDTISPLLNTSASSFIDNRLIQEKQRITQLTIPYYQEQNLLEQTTSLQLNNGQWQSNSKQTTDNLVEIIDNWQHASALQVIPLDALASTLQPSSFHAIVQLENQSAPIKLALYLNETSFFIVSEQTKLAYQFPKASYQTLLLPAPHK
jgi:hypothetical protein